MTEQNESSGTSRLYLKGRYLKLRRGISQTPFVLRNGQVMAEQSVESIVVEKLRRVVTGDEFKFIPAGREDLDVRMLGTGRPFVIEIKNPSPPTLTPEQLQELQAALSDASEGVRVDELQLAKRDAVLTMKCGEEQMHKKYCALVWIDRSVAQSDFDLLNNVKDMRIAQRTPLRVVHRRANATREKVIHWMTAKPLEAHDHYLTLELCTSAGCYIKEFIHGDFGRTVPALHELLQVPKAQCCALDVTHVALEKDQGREASAWEEQETTKKAKVDVTSDV